MERPQEILNAAADLFHHRGYHATTVEDIAGAVGLKKGSLYHYITGKDLILKTLAEETIQGYVEDAERISAEGGSAADRLSRVIAAHVERLCAAPERVTVLVREAHYVPDALASDVRGRTWRYTHLLSDLIAEGVERGEFSEVDPGVAGLMLLGALNWAHRWYQPEGRLTPEEIGRQFSQLFLRGLQRRDGDDVSL
jgi:AcrR family transcriptional regulator